MKIQFEGVPSGDGECFCWEVDEETYKQIEGEASWKLEKELKKDMKDTYGDETPWRLYPGTIFRGNKKQKITIIVEEE